MIKELSKHLIMILNLGAHYLEEKGVTVRNEICLYFHVHYVLRLSKTIQLFFIPSCFFIGSVNSRMARHNDNCKKLQDFTKYFSTFKETDSPDSIKNIVTTIHVSA